MKKETIINILAFRMRKNDAWYSDQMLRAIAEAESTQIENTARNLRVFAAVKDEYKRQCRNMDERKKRLKTKAVRDVLRKRLLAKNVASLSTAWPYKIGRASWAGGRNNFYFSFGDLNISVDSYREWSRNGKWCGNSYNFHISIPASQKWDVIGNLLTIYPRKNNVRETACVWYVQGSGMAVKPVEGYLIRGYHVKAKSLGAAKKKVSKLRSEAARSILEKRAHDRETRKNEIDRMNALRLVWVGIDDSVQGGNCRPGTENFVKRYVHPEYGNIGGIRADELYRLGQRTGNLYGVNRAIVAAEKRYR